MFKGVFDFRNQRILIRWKVVLPIIFFVSIGLLALSSTSNNNIFWNSTFYKQVIWAILAILFFIVAQYIRIQFLYDYSYIFYLLLFVLICATIFFPKIEGARRWIPIGPFYFQPSEIGKIIYIICLSRFFTDIRIKDKFSKILFLVLSILMIPPLLVFIQPDLGTAIVYFAVIVPMLYWSGFTFLLIFLLISPIISLLAVYNLTVFYIWMAVYLIVLIYNRPSMRAAIVNFILNVICGLFAQYAWNNILKDHQKQRIETFLDPLSDPLGTGYQVIQSIISIGSGGFWGKGWGNGTQTHLKFLPVRDTDFIISVIAEEMGFVTILFILLFLSSFLYWCFDYAGKIENKYSSLLLVGFTTLIFMHFIINMGMVAGLLPVTGLPVPFISYGGTFFISCAIMVGIINNIINNYI